MIVVLNIKYRITLVAVCVCLCFSVWLLSLLKENLGSSKNFIWYLFFFASRLWVISVHSWGLVEIKPELAVLTHYEEYMSFSFSNNSHQAVFLSSETFLLSVHVAWFPCCWCLAVITSLGEKTCIFAFRFFATVIFKGLPSSHPPLCLHNVHIFDFNRSSQYLCCQKHTECFQQKKFVFLKPSLQKQSGSFHYFYFISIFLTVCP